MKITGEIKDNKFYYSVEWGDGYHYAGERELDPDTLVDFCALLNLCNKMALGRHKEFEK